MGPSLRTTVMTKATYFHMAHSSMFPMAGPTIQRACSTQPYVPEISALKVNPYFPLCHKYPLVSVYLCLGFAMRGEVGGATQVDH